MHLHEGHLSHLEHAQTLQGPGYARAISQVEKIIYRFCSSRVTKSEPLEQSEPVSYSSLDLRGTFHGLYNLCEPF